MHLSESSIQKAYGRAKTAAGITKHGGIHESSLLKATPEALTQGFPEREALLLVVGGQFTRRDLARIGIK